MIDKKKICNDVNKVNKSSFIYLFIYSIFLSKGCLNLKFKLDEFEQVQKRKKKASAIPWHITINIPLHYDNLCKLLFMMLLPWKINSSNRTDLI